MRRSFLVGALALVVLGFCGAASATVIYDDFDGATVDTPDKWTLYDGTTVSQAGSVVTLDGSTTWMTLRSTASYDAAAQNTYEFLYVDGFGADSPYFGIGTDAGDYHAVVIRKQGGAWALAINAIAVGSLPTPAANDVLGLRRTADNWQVYQNGDLVLESGAGVVGFDSGETPKFLMQVRPGNTLSIGWVGVTAVPEPSAFVLLSPGLLGLLAYAWRRRR